MPFKMLVRAENSPTFPAPGSWAQGDIVALVPDTHVFGNKETLPLFIRVRISNSNNGDLGWLREATDGSGEMVNRREVRMAPAEVEAVKATWASRVGPLPTEPHVSFTRQQFNSRVVTRTVTTSADEQRANDLADVVRGIQKRDQEEKDQGLQPPPVGGAAEE